MDDMTNFVWGSCTWIQNNVNGGSGIRNTMVDTQPRVNLLRPFVLILIILCGGPVLGSKMMLMVVVP